MSDVDIHHLAAAYVLDALDPRERDEFETHYGACDVCRDDVVAFRRTLAEVAAAVAVPPPAAMKERVLAEIATTRQLSPRVAATADVVPLAGRRRVGTWLSVAAAVVLLAGIVTVLGLARRTSTSYADELAKVMEQDDATVTSLAPADGVQGTFRVAWSEHLGTAVLIGEGLPAAPAGTAYELWWFPQPDATDSPDSPNADGRLAMYVLDAAGDGNVHHVLDLPADPAAWAITLEPEGGAAVTTGDVIFIGAVA
ncbi:MAG: anti-sigma factor [Acidimicrobiaceae bacterium]|nr:anti-sigma factor [Ilumatobacter sp.]MCB9380852.1 anti-sigma factor [Acidimicrobiaceae bacterium]MCO5329869.1 anti-sigma factor [Ilumatobacteraceae bacterium]